VAAVVTIIWKGENVWEVSFEDRFVDVVKHSDGFWGLDGLGWPRNCGFSGFDWALGKAVRLALGDAAGSFPRDE
jgi:hypothetical protein